MRDDLQKGVRNSLGETVEDVGHTDCRGVGGPSLLNFEGKRQPAERGEKQFKASSEGWRHTENPEGGSESRDGQ